jgi:hypothetical protein
MEKRGLIYYFNIGNTWTYRRLCSYACMFGFSSFVTLLLDSVVLRMLLMKCKSLVVTLTQTWMLSQACDDNHRKTTRIMSYVLFL